MTQPSSSNRTTTRTDWRPSACRYRWKMRAGCQLPADPHTDRPGSIAGREVLAFHKHRRGARVRPRGLVEERGRRRRVGPRSRSGLAPKGWSSIAAGSPHTPCFAAKRPLPLGPSADEGGTEGDPAVGEVPALEGHTVTGVPSMRRLIPANGFPDPAPRLGRWAGRCQGSRRRPGPSVPLPRGAPMPPVGRRSPPRWWLGCGRCGRG